MRHFSRFRAELIITGHMMLSLHVGRSAIGSPFRAVGDTHRSRAFSRSLLAEVSRQGHRSDFWPRQSSSGREEAVDGQSNAASASSLTLPPQRRSDQGQQGHFFQHFFAFSPSAIDDEVVCAGRQVVLSGPFTAQFDFTEHFATGSMPLDYFKGLRFGHYTHYRREERGECRSFSRRHHARLSGSWRPFSARVSSAFRNGPIPPPHGCRRDAMLVTEFSFISIWVRIPPVEAGFLGRRRAT